MKLPDGVTIHTGGQKYKGEIPDNKAPKGLEKKLEKAKKPAKPATADKGK